MKKTNTLLAQSWVATYITSKFDFLKNAENFLVQF